MFQLHYSIDRSVLVTPLAQVPYFATAQHELKTLRATENLLSDALCLLSSQHVFRPVHSCGPPLMPLMVQRTCIHAPCMFSPLGPTQVESVRRLYLRHDTSLTSAMTDIFSVIWQHVRPYIHMCTQRSLQLHMCADTEYTLYYTLESGHRWFQEDMPLDLPACQLCHLCTS